MIGRTRPVAATFVVAAAACFNALPPHVEAEVIVHPHAAEALW